MQELINFPGINIQSLSQYILLLMLSTLRIGSFLLASPFFGSRMIPLPVRIVFSFSMGIWFLNNLKFPYLTHYKGRFGPNNFSRNFHWSNLWNDTVNMFWSSYFTGEKIATTSGLAFASQVDPSSGAQSPVISQIFSLFLLLLFFSVNGHLVVFELIIKSFETFPVGSAVNLKNALGSAIGATGFLYETAVIIRFQL